MEVGVCGGRRVEQPARKRGQGKDRPHATFTGRPGKIRREKRALSAKTVLSSACSVQSTMLPKMSGGA